MIVRRTLHRRGFRYRLHATDLPGSPDIVFPSRRFAVFVNGCFWHRHRGCKAATNPKTRQQFWHAKFERNVERDAEAIERLEQMGWRTHVVWECEAKSGAGAEKLLEALRHPGGVVLDGGRASEQPEHPVRGPGIRRPL